MNWIQIIGLWIGIAAIAWAAYVVGHERGRRKEWRVQSAIRQDRAARRRTEQVRKRADEALEAAAPKRPLINWNEPDGGRRGD